MSLIADEIKVWNAYRRGDAKAFEEIYNHYYERLSNYGYRFTSDSQYVEHAVQDLFVKLWKNRAKIGPTTSVKNYLYVAFRRIIIRQLQTRRETVELDEDDVQQRFEFVLSPESDLISKERLLNVQRRLNEALSKMNPHQREVIYLKFYEDLSYDEIAEILGISVKGTYKLLYRAMDTLKSQLGNFMFTILYWILVNMKKM